MDKVLNTDNHPEKILRHYESHYTWSHPIGDGCLAHKDGAVSLMISWQGVDTSLQTDRQRLNVWANFYILLNSLPENYCYEIHFSRRRDSSLSNRYLEKNKDMVRAEEFATIIRQSHADHLSSFSYSNSVYITVTKLPAKSPLAIFAKTNLKQQIKSKEDLIKISDILLRGLSGSRIAQFDEYRKVILQSFDQSSDYDILPDYNHNLLFTENVISSAPFLEHGMVRLKDRYTKVLLVYMYPNVNPGWFNDMAAVPANIHVSQIVLPADTFKQMSKAEGEQNMVEGMASNRGRYTTSKGLQDLAAYQKLVADENLSIFRNAFIINIHGTNPEHITKTAKDIKDWITRSHGQVKDNDYIQLPYFRASQPGQGYRCPTYRPDHTWQVADMLPVQVYLSGDSDPESLRLGSGSQLVGFNLSNQPVAHSFTVAMTGAGKGVDKGATIIETYPFGIDWYIAEVGESYRWTVEGLGGKYSTIDPDKDVVNPLPPFNTANPDPNYDRGELPLNAKIVGGTVQAMGFLLTNSTKALDQHQKAAAQMALQALYINLDDEREAPTLFDYFNTINEADFFDNKEQIEAAKYMSANLQSFLSTAEGKIFCNQDNLTLSSGITGVNLKDVEASSKELLQFYLVFLSLRFSQMAFYNPNNSRILLDEMHKFVEISPEVVGQLISAVSRMGRKDSGYIDLVTQGIKEIDAIEKEVLNSMPLRSLLYRPDGHDEIASRINMPDGVMPIWKSYPYPVGVLDYRQGLRSVGDEWHDLHLTFDKNMLALVDTSDLIFKGNIASETSDPLERIALFYRGK